MKRIVLLCLSFFVYYFAFAQSASVGQTETAAVNYAYSYLQYNVTPANIDSVAELQINNY